MPHKYWQPNEQTITHSHMHHFINTVNQRFNLSFETYNELYEWSIETPGKFWQACAIFCDLRFHAQPKTIIKPAKEIQNTKWFQSATLNFAENCLWRRDQHIALHYCNEQNETAQITYDALCHKTIALANHLKSLGLQPGDRVAGFVTNRIETVIAMLATTSLGAIWTACSPEFGLDALLDRFTQIEPVLLFAVSTHTFQGKTFHHKDTIVALQQHISSIKQIIFLDDIQQLNANDSHNKHTFKSFAFDHPLYILYSSGTTGKPKCMVHGAGNTLLQHKKELMLHTDLHKDDTIFFYTTCSWMMWHWLISGLSVGATIVLYDGSPFYPKKSALFDLIDQHKISIFGCGAKLFETYQKEDMQPNKTHQLTALKTILTTGSPLIKESFDYIYQHVKNDVRLSSISGGSDIISCFALGNPLLPVYAEEIQCRGLGMAVDIFNEQGNSVKNQFGELVCTQAFPSMPIYFWNDPNGEKYFHAYFDKFPNIWTHGDYAKITEHNGLIISGRSDATLNPGGIRIGTADIYEQVLKLPEITDCVAVGKQHNGDEKIILFVTLKENIILNSALIERIKQTIRQHLTPYHTPKKIIQVDDIPKTMNGKTMEIVVKNIINGSNINSTDTLSNPNSLEQFKRIAQTLD